MLAPEEDVDRIAEYADAGVRTAVRRGSLAPVAGRRGVSARLYDRLGNRGNAVVTGVGSLVVLALAGALAMVTGEPFVFPSLGATAFLLFETPAAEVASPRNALVGHGVAILCAAAAILVAGKAGDPSAFEGGVDAGRAVAIALATGATGGLLRLLRAAHPPAGATTIIVASGLLDTAAQMATLLAGVAVVVGAGVALNRAAGVPAPWWSPAPPR